MAATLRYNPDHTALEVTVGGITWAEDNDNDSIMLHHPGGCYVVVPEGADLEGLDNNSVYRLVKESTILKPEGDLSSGE